MAIPYWLFPIGYSLLPIPFGLILYCAYIPNMWAWGEAHLTYTYIYTYIYIWAQGYR